MMKLLPVLVLSAVIAAVLSSSGIDLRALYRKTQAQYGVNMNVLSSSPEESKQHFADFCQFAQDVAKHNAEDPNGYFAEVNMFALMSRSERYQYTGLNASDIIEEQKRSLSKRRMGSVPVAIEKRQSNVDYTSKLPPIKSQGSCGSCWTYGAVAALEYQVNRNSNNLKSLSEQQYLDCVYEGTRNGCNGGWPASCYDWTRDNGNMIASEKDYPYVASDGACRGAAQGIKTGIKGYSVTGTRYLPKGDANMLAAVSDKSIGVISIAFGVVDSFFSYRSGVYSATGCSSINHAMDIVGYGVEGGQNFWKVRNSWGPGWGNGGYVMVSRGPNICSISNHGHYPVVTGSDADDGEDDGSDEDDNKDDDEDDNEDDDEDDNEDDDEDDNEDDSALTWIQFNQEKSVTVTVSKNDPAKFYVKYPCDESVKYKIYFKTVTGAAFAHFEMYKKTSATSDLTGNLYCQNGGDKSWWGGEKTDFNLNCDAVNCRDGMKTLKVEKTNECVKVMDASSNEVLWSKMFDSTDGDCWMAMGSVSTQVWNYNGNDLNLAVCNKEEEDDGDDSEDSDDSDDGDDEEEKKVCRWVEKLGQKMKQKIQGDNMNKADAQKACVASEECNAITCKNNNKCWLNKKPKGKPNEKFIGYVLKCKTKAV